MEVHLGEETMVCSLCGKQFLTQSSLDLHIESHLEDRLYKCAHCRMGFPHYSALQDHMNIHTMGLDPSSIDMNNLQTTTDALYSIGGDKVLYHCALCSKEYYASGEHMNIHGPSYSGGQTHLCVDCCSRGQQHFSTLDEPTHIETLENIASLTMPSPTPVPPLTPVSPILLAPVSPPRKDGSAQKKIQVTASATDHMDSSGQIQVDNENSFIDAGFVQKTCATRQTRPCRVCGKLVHPTYVRIHEKIHSEDRSYTCHLCDKRFKAKQTLERHLFNHTDQRPFSCHLCKSTFKVKYQLTNHLRTHDKCKEKVSMAVMRRKRAIPGVKCPDCGKRFPTDSEFQGHITECSKNRLFLCCECGRKFTTQTNLCNHRRTHSEQKPHQCVQCGKYFRQINALKRHRILHTTDKPYWCVICTVAEYQTYKALRKHMIACRKEKGTASAEEAS